MSTRTSVTCSAAGAGAGTQRAAKLFRPRQLDERGVDPPSQSRQVDASGDLHEDADESLVRADIAGQLGGVPDGELPRHGTLVV
ncbi:MAG: hypothetical protein WAX29_07155 [Propionibacterium sp.]